MLIKEVFDNARETFNLASMTYLIISEAPPYQLKIKKCNLAVQCQSTSRSGQSVSPNDSF